MNETGNLLKLLLDNDFRDVARAQLDAPQAFEQFGAQRMPAGMTAHEAWDMVSGIGSLLGHPMPHAQLLGLDPDCWFRITPGMSKLLVELSAKTAETSPLTHSMQRRLSHGNFIRPYIDEVTAAFAFDGVWFDYDQLQQLVKGNRAIASDEDCMFMNTYMLMSNLMESGMAACSPKALAALHDRIAEGCHDAPAQAMATDEDAIAAVAGLLGATASRSERNSVIGNTSNDGGNATSANDSASKATGAHPLLECVMASEIIWQQKPFPRFNGVMELFVRAAFGLQHGMPSLSCVPLAQIVLPAQNAGQTNRAPDCLALRSAFGQDATPFLVQRLESIQAGIATLEGALAALDARDDALVALLEGDFRLNHRQRATMARAASEAAFAIDVAGYCSEHGVAVATARADLQKLVSLDYLLRDHDAARIVYRTRPDLQQKAESFASKRMR